MSKILPNSFWKQYRSILKDFFESFGQDTIVWLRNEKIIPIYFEDMTTKTSEVSLNVLVGYNDFRKWPVTKRSDEGNYSGQNLIILIHLDYLDDLGYLDSNKNFIVDEHRDKFLIRGRRYSIEGITQVSQAGDTPTHIQIILQVDETKTGESVLNQQ